MLPMPPQRAMDQILQGIGGVQCYLDDIIVTGEDDKEHYKNVDAVLSLLDEAGLNLNTVKCEFMQDRVEYYGHIIDDRSGLHRTEDKVKAVVEAPAPQNVSQLPSWLGFLNYFQKFMQTSLQSCSICIKSCIRELEVG